MRSASETEEIDLQAARHTMRRVLALAVVACLPSPSETYLLATRPAAAPGGGVQISAACRAAAPLCSSSSVPPPGGISNAPIGWRQQLQQRLGAIPMLRKRDELLRCCGSGSTLRIVAIGSWFYAAVAAGIVNGKETKPRYVPCSDVLTRLLARANGRRGTETSSDDDIEARANALRSCIVLEWLLHYSVPSVHASQHASHAMLGVALQARRCMQGAVCRALQGAGRVCTAP